MIRKLVRILALLAAVWAVFCGYMFWLMTRPVPQFTAGVARLPSFAMMLTPFPPMWNVARGGRLDLGDPAPDFDLETVDRASRVRLSAHRGERPVVLVFGSYT